jgi:aspartyl-tRNA(Asn)/glutamyl-tRNA(Gln) amidotransferase subunit C
MSEAAKVLLEDVRRVAELAHLELSSEEESRMQRDLSAILGHVNQLNALDTTAVAPLAQIAELFATPSGLAGDPSVDLGANLRADAPRPSLDHATVLASAPAGDGVYFKVPKVIER